MAIVGWEWIIILNIVLAVVVLLHSGSRNLSASHRILWFVATAILGLFGVILYLILGKPSRVCPQCGRAVERSPNFCRYCGIDLKTVRVCPKCGAKVKPGGAYCEKCGNKLA